jgi:hypothetical protein
MKPSRPMARAVSAPEENEAPASPGANCFLAEKSSYGNRLVFPFQFAPILLSIVLIY